MHQHYTTHPGDDQVKRVCPAPQGHNVPETPQARLKRLMAQAAANRVRVRNQGDGRFTVPSQRHGPDGTPVTTYLVADLADTGFACNCEWALRHGPYQVDDNPIGLCSHIAQVLKYLARDARRQARQARQAAEGAASAAPSRSRVVYQADVEQAFRDLFGEAAPVAGGRVKDCLTCGRAALGGNYCATCRAQEGQAA